MNVVALLSSGRHPVSGQLVLPRLEAQMVRLAVGLGAARGLHAGVTAAPASEALGHGLSVLDHLPIGLQNDPIPALAARLADLKPELVLAGRRSQGQDETGLVPYAIAKTLALPLVPDAVDIVAGGDAGTLIIDQALPKGAIRRLTVRWPVVVTIHPNAPAPHPFAFGQARRGRIETIACAPLDETTTMTTLEERPYRPRPKMMRTAPAGGTAAERLKAATGSVGGKTNVLIDPAPEVAAQEILGYLRRVGVLRSAT